MVDILQVLEGLAYIGFIGGAIFAVLELRTMSKASQTELILRVSEFWSSKDFEEAFVKVRELESKDPKQIEEKCTKQSLFMVVDYIDGIADLARLNLLNRDVVLDMIAYDLIWDRMEPWIAEERRMRGNPEMANGLEYAAAEVRRMKASQQRPS